jgi:translocation and assembly module TamB
VLDASIDDYPLGSVASEMRLAENKLSILSLRAEHMTTLHEASGAIDFPDARKFPRLGRARYSINASLSEGDLGGLLRVLGLRTDTEGGADARVEITGWGLSPVISGDSSMSNIVSYGRAVDAADVQFVFEQRKFHLKRGIFSSGNASMNMEGMVSLDREFQFNAKGQSLSLGLITGRELPVEAKVDLRSEGSGTFDDPSVSVSADLRDTTYGGYRIGTGRLNASLKGKAYSIDGKLADGKMRFKGSGETGEDAAWKVDMGLSYGRYNFLLGPVLASPPHDLVFGLEGKVALWGTRRHVNADISIKRLLVNIYGQGFTNIDPVKAVIRDKRLALERTTIRGGNTMFDLGGSLVFGGRMNIRVNGKSSLLPFGALSKNIDSIKGDADFAISITGTVHTPMASGRIRISDGSIALKSMPQRITDINGTILVEGSRAIFDGVKARFGGGDVRLSGSVGHRGFELTSMAAELFIRDVTVYLSKNFVVDIGGSLYLSGSPASPHVNGELWVDRGLYRERIEWKSWLIAGRRTIPKAERDWRERVRLNVRLFGKDNIKVENNIAVAKLSLDMFVRGTLGTPLLFGRIESVEGKVYFRNTQFNIIHASADYSDSVSSSPYIDIYAQTNIKGYQVLLNLEGRMQQMDLVLSSDPPLEDVEILALLTLGETGKALDGIEGGVGAAEATSFLTGEIQDVMEERFTEMTGFDRFSIDPYVSSKTGAVTPRVTVGKRLVGDRVFVKYASSLGPENEQELKLELLLGENVSLIGGQETTGSIGGDIVFRLRFE